MDEIVKTNNIISPIVEFKNIILVEETFKREKFIPDGLVPKLNFGIKNMVDESDANNYWVEITTSLDFIGENGTSYINLNVKYVGDFKLNIRNQPEMKDAILSANLPAMMLPYIREHITCITSKCGIQPVIIPPINLSSFIQKNHIDIEK